MCHKKVISRCIKNSHKPVQKRYLKQFKTSNRYVAKKDIQNTLKGAHEINAY